MSKFLNVAALAMLALGQDVDKFLEKADFHLEEAKSKYEEGRSKRSAAAFVEAGSKLEEARIKYLVLQELGQAEKQKIAADRLRAVQQLAQLIHDGKAAITPAPDGGAPPRPLPPAKIAADVAKRAAVPDPARIRDAEKKIRDIYKEQYSKKAPADRVLLAKALLEKAEQTAGDPAARYVLLRDAQDFAAQAGDLPTALQSVENAASIFDVDPLPLKQAALSAAGKIAKTGPEFAELVEASLKLVDELVAVDQYDAADKALQAALQHARRTAAPPIIARATAKAKDVADARARFAGIRKTLESLAKNPDDGAANLEMGQLFCFVRSNWDLGVRFLARSSDPALKAAAERDLAGPTQSADQCSVGDGWWELSEKTRIPGAKEKMQNRALTWYEAALPGATGLNKIKLEKRLSEANRMEEPAMAGLVGRWVCNEGEGATVADTSGKGNHGTLNGVGWAPGLTGNALDFGRGGHVTCGVSGMPALNGAMTLAWAAFDPVEPGKAVIMVLDDLPSRATLSPGYKDGRLCVWKWGEAMLLSTAPATPGEWHQYAYTFDGTTHKLYVDGALKDSSTTAPHTGTVRRLELGQWIGGGEFGPGNQYQGLLDEIRIYSRALSDFEVRSLVRRRR